jgi:hypothetical protein
LRSFPLEDGAPEDLAALLAAGWEDQLSRGVIAYDPSRAEVVTASPYRFHYLPERASRPGARKSPATPEAGVHAPHAPCPFDGEDFVEEREVVRVSRGGRVQHLACNRYPVTPLHFLAVREATAPPQILPQRIHGPEEIEDSLLLLAALGPPYRFYFNSNRGADDSRSGSSVNHWHFQLFPYPSSYESPLLERPSRTLRREKGLRIGRVESWPAAHLFIEGESGQSAAAAEIAWRWLRAPHERRSAYNIEEVPLGGRTFRLFLFPRRHAPDAEVPGAGALAADFGGWELSGDIVIPTREILDRVKAEPAEARRITEKRLRDTTREVEL